jgi:IPT/TIG domain-containing protein
VFHRQRSGTGCERAALFLVLLSGLAGAVCAQPLAATAIQNRGDVSPDATPVIVQIQPSGAMPGVQVTVEIEGRDFSRGAYVSFSNPAVRVVSTRRVNATRLEAKLAIAPKAQPGSVNLYVSNPAGAVAEAAFTIGAATASPGQLPASAAGPQPSTAGTPEVTAVEPPRVARGSAVSLKVKGKNFVPGAKVCFSNPAILVVESKTSKSTELTARLQIPADAPTGATSLFVVNPDEREVEVPFEVTDGATQTAQKPVSTPAAGGAGSAALHFEVLNLGEAAAILQDPGKAKGTLSLLAGRLQYEEGGTRVFSAARREIKEIALNVILGINTGTFHVILDSGKTYNFMAASLRAADSQSIVDSLRRALP